MYSTVHPTHGYAQPFAQATAHAMAQPFMQASQAAQRSPFAQAAAQQFAQETAATAHAKAQAPQLSAPPSTQYANPYTQYVYTSAQPFAPSVQQFAPQYAQAAGKSFVPPTLASAQPFGAHMPLAMLPGKLEYDLCFKKQTLHKLKCFLGLS